MTTDTTTLGHYRDGLERARDLIAGAAWRHEGDDAYSQGLDNGARHQVVNCVAAIEAEIASLPSSAVPVTPPAPGVSDAEMEAAARAMCVCLNINPDCENPFENVPGVPKAERVQYYWQANIKEARAALEAAARVRATDCSAVEADGGFYALRQANVARNVEWSAGNVLSLSFRGNELAGEVGEACNVLKKLDRERMGLVGSRATIEQLAEELADVVICADLAAMDCNVDLWRAVVAKFNATSEKRGLRTRLEATVHDRFRDDDGCPKGDPECLSDNGDCHEACARFVERAVEAEREACVAIVDAEVADAEMRERAAESPVQKMALYGYASGLKHVAAAIRTRSEQEPQS